MLTLVLLFMVSFLTACGGGGGGSSTSTPTSTVGTVTTLTQTLLYQNTDQVSGLINYGVADLNGDGLEDVVISEWPGEPNTTVPNAGPPYAYNKIPVKILLQQTNGTMLDATSTLLGANNLIYGTQRVVIQDFDNDGKLDIFLAGFQDSCCYNISVPSVLFWNNGTSFSRLDFTENIRSPGACTGDLTGSGFQDIVTSTLVYKNNGNRTFTTINLTAPVGQPGSAACTIIKDATTGNIGVASGNTGPAGYNAAIYVYDSHLNYINTIGIPGFAGAIGSSDPNNFIQIDMNGDGTLDLLVTDNGTDNHNGSYHALINNGGFNFTDETSTYFPNQLGDTGITFAFSYRLLTQNNIQTAFIPITDTNWNSNTDPGLIQLQNNQFVNWNPGTFSQSIGSYHYPIIYKTSIGMSLLIATVNGNLPNPQTNTFYTIGF